MFCDLLLDGKFVVANDTLISNQLVDAFASFTLSDGDPIKQTIQVNCIQYCY